MGSLLGRGRADGGRVAAQERAAATLDSIGDGVLSTDLAGNITYLNPAAEVMTGWAMSAAAGRPLREVFRIIDRATREPARDPLSLAVQLNRTVGLTPNCVLIRRDGREIEIEDSAAPIHDKSGHVTGAVIVFRDVGASLQTSRQMSHLAQHDVLTGLPNRLLLDDRLTAAIALAHRRRKPLALLFLDVDGFKDVNDELGHATGDRVLQSIAARLSETLRHSDTVSRYGGDEFLIVLAEIAHADHASLVATKLLEAVAKPHVVDGQHIRVTVSIGISLYPEHGVAVEALIANADAAMYGAKRGGPGHARLFQSAVAADDPPGVAAQGDLFQAGIDAR